MLSILAKVIRALSYITRTKHASHRFLASAVSVVQGYDMGILLILTLPKRAGSLRTFLSSFLNLLRKKGKPAKSLLHMKEV